MGEDALRAFNTVGGAEVDSPLRKFAESPRFGSNKGMQQKRLQENKVKSSKAKTIATAYHKYAPGEWSNAAEWFHSQRSSVLPPSEVPSCDGSCRSCSSSLRSRSSSRSSSPSVVMRIQNLIDTI